MLFPTLNRILVRPDKAPEKSPGGIVLPDEARDKQKPSRGTILAVGPGNHDDNGEATKVRLTAGDTVYYQNYTGHKIEDDGEDLLVLEETDVLCIWKEGK